MAITKENHGGGKWKVKLMLWIPNSYGTHWVECPKTGLSWSFFFWHTKEGFVSLYPERTPHSFKEPSGTESTVTGWRLLFKKKYYYNLTVWFPNLTSHFVQSIYLSKLYDERIFFKWWWNDDFLFVGYVKCMSWLIHSLVFVLIVFW